MKMISETEGGGFKLEVLQKLSAIQKNQVDITKRFQNRMRQIEQGFEAIQDSIKTANLNFTIISKSTQSNFEDCGKQEAQKETKIQVSKGKESLEELIKNEGQKYKNLEDRLEALQMTLNQFYGKNQERLRQLVKIAILQQDKKSKAYQNNNKSQYPKFQTKIQAKQSNYLQNGLFSTQYIQQQRGNLETNKVTNELQKKEYLQQKQKQDSAFFNETKNKKIQKDQMRVYTMVQIKQQMEQYHNNCYSQLKAINLHIELLSSRLDYLFKSFFEKGQPSNAQNQKQKQQNLCQSIIQELKKQVQQSKAFVKKCEDYAVSQPQQSSNQESVPIFTQIQNKPLIQTNVSLLQIVKEKNQNYQEDDCESFFIKAFNNRIKGFGRIQLWQELEQLNEIDVSEGSLVALPQRLFALKNLKFLFLSNNKICEFPEKLCQLKQLQTLLLYSNQVSELPNEIDQLKSLELFSIHHNPVKKLPKNFQNLKKLKRLRVPCQVLDTLPVQDLVGMRELHLYYNNQISKKVKEFQAKCQKRKIKVELVKN